VNSRKMEERGGSEREWWVKGVETYMTWRWSWNWEGG
jgi:hypothetical protein